MSKLEVTSIQPQLIQIRIKRW